MIHKLKAASIIRYGLAIVITLLAAWLRYLIHPYFEAQVPFIIFYVAAFIAAWYGGLGPALLAIVLSILLAGHYFIPPADSLLPMKPSGWVRLILFTSVSLMMAVLIERMRRETEHAHQERERFFVTLSSIGDGVIVTDEKACITFLNPVAEKWTGWTTAEAHGKPLGTVFRIIDEQTRKTTKNPVVRVLREGQVVGPTNHTLLLAKDNTERSIDNSAAPIQKPNGDMIGVVLSFRDITERKRTEQVQRFLAEVSQSLSTLVDYKSTLQKVAHLAVPLFADWCAVDIVNADGSVERLAVAHEDPARAELLEDLFRRYPPHANTRTGVMNVLRTGKPEMVSQIPGEMLKALAWDAEHLKIIQDLQLRSYMCVPLEAKGRIFGTLTFVFAESGRKYRPDDLVMAEDLAHRAAIAIENARLYQEVREANQRKNEFLAMLAHELRNPLTPIRLGLDVLAIDAGEHQEIVTLMQEQVKHVVRLVDDLLDVSRIMQGKVELRKEAVDLATVLKRSTQVVQELFNKHQQELIISIPEEPIWLFADPVRLAQVVENLLNNASKYTNDGGRIELTVECQDAQAVISVRDNGIGIEPELLPRVFDVFTQSSRALDRAQGGMGIGLTLVQRLVDMHSGTVTAHSKGPGHGSTFIVQLPVVKRLTPTQETIELSGNAQDRHILIVDDNVGAVRLLSLLLAKLGDHKIETAYDGPSALEKFKQTHPQLVFLDIGLPGMDGYQVGQAIHDIKEPDDVLLVALTGYGQAEDHRASREAGFDEHLVKPPSVEQIKAILAHPKLERARTST